MISLVLALVLSIIAMVGCQGASIDSEPATPTPSAPAQTSPGNSGKEEELKLAVLVKTLANEYFADFVDGMDAACKERGINVEFFAAADESDIQGQLRKFEDILMQDFNVIAFVPITEVGLNSAIARANEMGIPVVCVDDLVDVDELAERNGWIDYFVSADNILMGTLCAQAMVESLPEGGEVLIIEGMAGTMPNEYRKEGFIEGIKGSGLEVISSQPGDWDRAKALDITTNALSAYPNLKAIFCANDTMSLGAAKAVENAGRTGEIMITGVDGVAEAIDAVYSGHMTATVLQDIPTTTAAVAESVLDAFEKRHSLTREMVTIFVDLVLVDKSNAEQYKD